MIISVCICQCVQTEFYVCFMNRRQSCTCLLQIKCDPKDAVAATTTNLIIIKILVGIHGMSLSMERENMCSFQILHNEIIKKKSFMIIICVVVVVAFILMFNDALAVADVSFVLCII